MYVIYSPEGAIIATVMGPDSTYGEILDKEGRLWLFAEGIDALDPMQNHIDVANCEIAPNHAIELVASKVAIKANNTDTSIITGIPVGAAVNIECDGQYLAGEIVDDGQVELAVEAPGTYKITVSKPTYNPTTIEVTAT